MLITHDFCEALAKRATEFIKFPETEQEVLQSIGLFTNKSPFPQVVGAVDGSHIALKQCLSTNGLNILTESKIILLLSKALLMRLLDFLM